ncbi:hypothetical protein ACTG2D_05225 [Aeromonas veronii]|jgi:hypothetical protein
MSYQYDLADFKRYLQDRNRAYRVDGLIFWQNRIPLPIDLFNRIFDESDQIVTDYIYQLAASTLAFNKAGAFEEKLGHPVSDLPTNVLERKYATLSGWVTAELPANSPIARMAYEIAEMLSVPEFEFSADRVVAALLHQGKKYTRLFMPGSVRELVERFAECGAIGQDNSDMFGNIIADRYNVYRSGFSDALAIIFNALLDFRLLFSGKGNRLQKISVITSTRTDLDVRFAVTTDGSLWEPGYEDDHYVTINNKHPLIRKLSQEQSPALAELLFFLAQFENSQFSDQNKKFIENMRQALSRELWIKYD